MGIGRIASPYFFYRLQRKAFLFRAALCSSGGRIATSSPIMNRLTSRERILLVLVLGVLFVLGNMSLFSWLSGKNAKIRTEFASKRSELKSMKVILEGGQLWAEREAWLNANQPKLTSPEQAGVQLLDQIKEVARANDVLLESPELGGLEVQSACRSVSVQVATKSTWPNLVKFLHSMQQPGRFIVFESANLQIDPSNATRMACRFKIAKWYAL